MIRLFVALDNLLETLIFDVLLATSRRRRIAAVLAVFSGIVFYGISGLLFVPEVFEAPEKIDCAPFITSGPMGSLPELVREVANRHDIPKGRSDEFERALRPYHTQLDELVSRLATRNPTRFPETPNYRTARESATALTARGVWHARNRRGDRAMVDWITALRLARRVMVGTAQRPVRLIEGMVASAMERQTLQALTWFSGLHMEMTPGQWNLMQAELRERKLVPHSLSDYMTGERIAIESFFAQACRDGGIEEGRYWIVLSRALMPLRKADRSAFFGEVRDRFLREFDADRAATVGNTSRASNHELQTDYFLVLAPFSHEHSVQRMTNLLLFTTNPNYARCGERLELTEALARALERSVPPLDAQAGL